jgi:hypothetical protein
MAQDTPNLICCDFNEKGLCVSSKHKLRKNCHKDCHLCQRHHDKKCGKLPKKGRKPLGDISNKTFCGGKQCSSHSRLCDVEHCKQKELCIRCCPCNEQIATRDTTRLLRGSKEKANLRLKDLIIYEDDKELPPLGQLEPAPSSKAMELADLKELFPGSIVLKNIPSKAVRSSETADLQIEKMSERALRSLLGFFQHIVEKVAETLLPGKPFFLIEKLFLVILSPLVLGYSIASQTAFMIRMATTTFKLANSMPRNTVAYRVVGAIIASCGSQHELDACFPDMESPRLGKDARRRRKNDLEWMLETALDPKFVERSVQRVDDDLIRAMVYDILSPDNMHLLAVSMTIPLLFYVLDCY